MGTPIVDRLQALADATRNRLLLLLEEHELTVGELGSALQLPQSTTSRHLKLLADDGWVVSRADGSSRFYAMAVDLDVPARRLWQVVREQAADTPAARRDMMRLRGVLAQRRAGSEAFFESAGGQWDRMRAELFGYRAELLPMVGLLEPSWVVADLGCGTGHFSQLIASFVRQVIAVDASEAMLSVARTRVSDTENVDIRRGELESLPLDDADVDLACMVLVLPYVAEPQVAITEAARVLKPGGRLLITDLMPHEMAEYRQTMGHQRQGVTEREMLDWLARAGLGGGRYIPLPLAPDAKGPRLFTATGLKKLKS